MMKTISARSTALVIALATASPNAWAATVSVNGDVVTFSGQFSWVPGTDVDPARDVTNYEINVPIAGSPFDPNFSPPPAVRDQQTPPVIGRDLEATVATPNTETGTDTGTVNAQVVDYDGDEINWGSRSSGLYDPQPVLNDQFVWLNTLETILPANEGTTVQTFYDFFVNFSDDYTQIESIAATYEVESSLFTPIPGQDPIVEFATNNWLGLDFLDAPIDVADVIGGGPGEPPVSPNVIPLPPAAALMMGGFGLLGLMRRRRRN